MIPRIQAKTTLIDRIKGRDLPGKWAKKAGVLPNEAVQIIIGPSQRTAAVELVKTMRIMAVEAKRKGLTGKKLRALLKDE